MNGPQKLAGQQTALTEASALVMELRFLAADNAGRSRGGQLAGINDPAEIVESLQVHRAYRSHSAQEPVALTFRLIRPGPITATRTTRQSIPATSETESTSCRRRCNISGSTTYEPVTTCQTSCVAIPLLRRRT